MELQPPPLPHLRQRVCLLPVTDPFSTAPGLQWLRVCVAACLRIMRDEREEEIRKYNYKYFGRSTEGEKHGRSAMSRTCEDDGEQRIRGVDNMMRRW
ncbi:hypothetical protein EYF80_053830 [Liparis tanakae]|uniref:Uncharacterized protein n=1 Tax=Liparis tanakae TaxID=230148 RepID=A0A4Z2F6C5_9TELE|nr:hypothetical protein EYF80_053830 [Liparis tanakae]